MTKKTKTIILIISILAFFILSWLIVLYAYGYYFDFKNFEWIKTGGFLIKTNTANIEVFINDRLKGSTSLLANTFVEKNLLPGNYNIRLEKDDFSQIYKNVEIKSGEASQLIHIYLTNREEIESFINNSASKGEELNYFISKKDGLLYKKLENDKVEKISSEPVYIKDFTLKVLDNNVYLVSQDSRAQGIFLLDTKGEWNQIYETSASDLLLSPDKKKFAVISENEIFVLWIKDENEPPYFKKNHKELVLRISEKITKVYWFKTDWHLIYLTVSGETHFVEVDPTGGRNDVRL